jgi:hypothetical protein
MNDIYYVRTNVWVLNRSFRSIIDAKSYIKYLYNRKQRDRNFKGFKRADLLLNGKALLFNIDRPITESSYGS